LKFFNYLVNTEQQDLLAKIISGTLPHENVNHELVPDILKGMFEVVEPTEVYGLYYIFYKLYSNIQSVSLIRHSYNPELTRDVLDSSLSAQIVDIIIRPEFNAIEFFKDYGKSYDLNIEKDFLEAQDIVYTETLNKYDEMFNDLKIKTEDSLQYLEVLKDSMRLSLTAKRLSTEAQIISPEGYKYRNTLYKGYEAVNSFSGFATREISERFDHGSKLISSQFQIVTIKSFEESKQFDKDNHATYLPLYKVGFQPYDDRFTICTGDSVAVVGTEGTGKTRFLCDQVYKAIVSGVNVLYLTGESIEIKIKKLVEGIHLFNLFGVSLSWPELVNFTQLYTLSEGEIKSMCERLGLNNFQDLEDLSAKINASITDLDENKSFGKLSLVKNIYYEDALKTLSDSIVQNNIQVVVVDHVAAMASNGAITSNGRLQNESARIGFLLAQENVLTSMYNTTFINASHTNLDTYHLQQKDSNTTESLGPRITSNSSVTSKQSSFVFYLHSTPELSRQDLVYISIQKARDIPDGLPTLVLARHGDVCQHYYNEDLQARIVGLQKSSNINEIEDLIEDSD
jgi:hypothetical protein